MSLPPADANSTVVVTGASAGIGAELARGLARRGYSTILVARRADRLEELADELRREHGVRSEARACDLGDDAARGELLRSLRPRAGDVVGVCNNAGFGTFGRFAELPLERETEMVRLNVLALHEITGAFLPGMVERGAGAILNVGSVAGFQPLPGNATYAATKAFVNSFSEAVHSELAGTGVSCTVVCPGPVRTEFADVAGAGNLESAAPDRLWLTAGEVAEAAIDGMLRGRRTVVPGVTSKLASTSGRFVPRTLLLPVVRRVVTGRLRD